MKNIVLCSFCFMKHYSSNYVCYIRNYIGYTTDLIDRFHSHNRLATKGYTIKFRPWKVIHVEFFDSKTDALKREQQLKSSRGRDFIRKLIQI